MTIANPSGRVVLVVGASSGIGLAAALAFARCGDHLVLNSRSDDALKAAEKACHAAGVGDIDIVSGDITDPITSDRLVARALDRHGRIDVVVHSATVTGYGTVEVMPPDVFLKVVETAVHGTLHLGRAILPIMRRQGSGVFIGVNSLLGSVTVPQMGAYATSKWGQRAVLRTLQQETRDVPGVHVCIVSPGSINTPIYYQAANYTGRAHATTVAGASARTRRRHDRAPRRAATPAGVRTGWPEQSGHRGWIPTAACHLRPARRTAVPAHRAHGPVCTGDCGQRC